MMERYLTAAEGAERKLMTACSIMNEGLLIWRSNFNRHVDQNIKTDLRYSNINTESYLGFFSCLEIAHLYGRLSVKLWRSSAVIGDKNLHDFISSCLNVVLKLFSDS